MPSIHIPTALRRKVVDRANQSCEFCLLHSEDAEFPHEIDHFIPLSHGGESVEGNLVLACLKCNRRKGTNLTAIDPLDHSVALLFNPRQQAWRQHFTLVGAYIIGITPTVRATTTLLRLNDERRVEWREALIRARRYPAKWD